MNKLNNELSFNQKSASVKILILAYLISVLGGGLGSIIGINYLIATKEDVNGRKCKKYDKATRRHGIFIIITGLLFSSLYI